MKRIRQALRFTATRKLLRSTLAHRIGGPVVLIAALFVAGLPYIGLRAVADNFRAPIDGASLERTVFGGLPTLGLQNALHGDGLGLIERAAIGVHMSWFVVPPLVTLLVAFRYRDEFASYALWRLATPYLALIGFVLFPMTPPWMADSGVVRILALNWGQGVDIDANTVAAMPSLHVALPLALTVWSFRKRHNALGGGLAAFTALTAVSVVYLGEHFVIDLMGSVALVATVAAIAEVVERRLWRRDLAARPAGPVPAYATQRGQNLIEFAMLAPFIMGLLGGIVILGIGLNTRSSLQQAVREGARQMAVGASEADARTLAAGNAPEVLDSGDVAVCYPMNGTSQGKVGDPVRVFLVKGDGSEGYDYTIVSTGGILKALGIGDLTVTMRPRATTRLEKSVSSPADC